MTDFQKDVVAIMRHAIGGEKPNLSGKFDIEKFKVFAICQQIVCLMYYGIIDVDGVESDKLIASFGKHYAHVETQVREAEKLYSVLNKANINYMLMKGILLREIYPIPEMREMGDIDVLVGDIPEKKLKDVMMSIGYELQGESEYDYQFVNANNECLHIELHKNLSTKFSVDVFKYFKEELYHSEISCYKCKPEDMYIYIFQHFAKHFSDFGCGIKYLADFYLYKKAYPNLDFEYIGNEFEKSELTEFYRNICDTIDVWFSDKEPTETTDYITNCLFEGGVYGSEAQFQRREAVMNMGNYRFPKLHKALSMFFLPYVHMKQKYPILKKCKWLLPLFWIVRGFSVIFTRPSRIKQRIDDGKILTKENFKQGAERLDKVGLRVPEYKKK